jgi:hypothetical protein
MEGIAKPGGICLSSSAFEHVQGKVNVAVADAADFDGSARVASRTPLDLGRLPRIMG